MIRIEQMVVMPTYRCPLCRQETPHLVLTTAAERAIIRCQSCDLTHLLYLGGVQ